jgi:hypothetical protein
MWIRLDPAVLTLSMAHWIQAGPPKWLTTQVAPSGAPAGVDRVLPDPGCVHELGRLASVGACLESFMGCVSVPLVWKAGSLDQQVLEPVPVHFAVTAMPILVLSRQRGKRLKK